MTKNEERNILKESLRITGNGESESGCQIEFGNMTKDNTVYMNARTIIDNYDNDRKVQFIEEIIKGKFFNESNRFEDRVLDEYEEEELEKKEWMEKTFLNTLIGLYKGYKPDTLVKVEIDYHYDQMTWDLIDENKPYFIGLVDDGMEYDEAEELICEPIFAWNVRLMKSYSAELWENFMTKKYGKIITKMGLTEIGKELDDKKRNLITNIYYDSYKGESLKDIFRYIWCEEICGNISQLDGKPTCPSPTAYDYIEEDIPLYLKVIDITGAEIKENDKEVFIKYINDLLMADTSEKLANISLYGYLVTEPNWEKYILDNNNVVAYNDQEK